MIEASSIVIVGKNSLENLYSHQSQVVSCNLNFNGEAVFLDCRDHMILNFNDCIAMRDFLDMSIKNMQKKEEV